MLDQTQGYYAIDDIDIRDGFCGTTPEYATRDRLTTPSSGTRPTTAAQSCCFIIKHSLHSRCLLISIYSSSTEHL